MPRKLTHLTPAQDALLGRCVRAFGYLEYSLGSLIIELHKADGPAAVASGEVGKPPQLEQLLLKAFKSRNSYLASELDRLLMNHDDLRDLMAKFWQNTSDLVDLRNHFCHGVWTSVNENAVEVYFWPRDSLRRQDSVLRAQSETLRFENGQLAELAAIVFKFGHLVTAQADHLEKYLENLPSGDEQNLRTR